MAKAPGDDSVSRPSRVEEAMAKVRASLPGRGNGKTLPAASTRGRPHDASLFPEDVYRSLHQARTLGGGISVHYNLGYRTPFVGPIWMVVRKRIHAEIRIYIDALTQQQSQLNTHVVRVLTHAVETLDGLGLPALKRQQLEQGQLVEELRAEVQALRARCDRLEARLASDETPPTLDKAARN